MKDDRLYLIHISECIGRIEQYVAGGRDAFMESTLIQDAVVRNLQILTESTQRLSDAFKSTNQEVPWRDLAGFRNVLVHDYLGIDTEYVWKVVERDLPRLKEKITAMLCEPPN